MRLQFKVQRYQTEAVNAVADCFAGQPRLDGGDAGTGKVSASDTDRGNAEIALSPATLLENIRAVQRARGLPPSAALASSAAADGPDTPNLDIEMETGTGKTYVYIKTIMELNQRYGWSRFIVVVPGVAIREGVRTAFDITAEHFQQSYGSKPRSFCYSSSRFQELEQFSSGAGVQVMIINIQAFNTHSQDSRRIYEELDQFQSRRPVDVISATRPVVIIDEPQRIGSAKSLRALSRLHPLMVLRYSATHRTEHNKVHRLDAADAYQRQLVKKIAVRGITVQGLPGTAAYLYLDGTETVAGATPRARVELEVRTPAGIQRQVRRLRRGASLHAASGGIEAYRGLFITDIDAARDVIELSGGDVLAAGRLTGDVTEETLRRIQIREVIRAHLDKEQELFALGVKVLSLLFVDAVARYRDYSRADTRGVYARIFEQEYREQVRERLARLPDGGRPDGGLPDGGRPDGGAGLAYRRYLAAIPGESTHRGYFCVDKKTGRVVDGDVKRAGDEKGQSTDADAYDLILRDKERLLSLEENVRFIFSHSALREGWDNPNVFVLGMLKKSDSTVSRRQEIGRGLRLAVNSRGERMDDPATVHQINELTVVTDESYTAFVDGLQREISVPAGRRPPLPTDGRRHRHSSPGPGRLGPGPSGPGFSGPGYSGGAGLALGPARESGTPAWPAAFDSGKLIARCVATLDDRLQVESLEYLVSRGGQRPADGPGGFTAAGASTRAAAGPSSSSVEYDLLGEIAVRTQLTRRTTASILRQIKPGTFGCYRQNPEQFISACAHLINEQLAEITA